MTLRHFFVALSCLLMFLCSAAQPVQAFWFHKKKPAEDPAVQQVRTYQPPPENSVTLYCEPFRKEAAVLDQKPRLLKVFYAPRRMWLISKHRKCKDELMEQERIYLKHVDIERPPSLPKLKMDAPAVQPHESQPASGEKNGAE